MQKLDEAVKICPQCRHHYRMARMNKYCPNCASLIWVEDRYEPILIKRDDVPIVEKMQQISTLFRTFKNFLQEN